MLEFLFSLLGVALSMSAIILLLLLFFKLCGKNFTAKCRYIVWVIVILRLCIPFGGSFSPKLVSIEVPIKENTVIKYRDISANDTLIADTASELQTSPPILSTQEFTGTEMTDRAEKEAEFDETYADPVSLPSLDAVIFTLWISGASVFLAAKLLSYNIYRRKLMRRPLLPNEEICRSYANVCKELKLKNPPKLYISDTAKSPLLFGYFKHVILLPSFICSDEELKRVLTHELIHHRRGDIWIKLLAVIANSLFFFDPLVYAAISRLDLEMELSCDEKLLSDLDSSARLSYGTYMLKIVKRARRRESSLTTFYSPAKGALKERFMNIIEEKTRNHGISVITLVLILCMLAGSVIGCSRKAIEKNEIKSYFKNGDVIALTPEEIDFPSVTFERKEGAALTKHIPTDNALSTFLNQNHLYIMSEHTSSRYSNYFELIYENGCEPVCIYAGNAEKAEFNGKSFEKLFGENGFCFGYYVSSFVDVYFSTTDGGVPKPFFKSTKETSLIDIDRDGECEMIIGNSIYTTSNGKAVKFNIDADVEKHFDTEPDSISIEFPYSAYNYVYRLSYNDMQNDDGSYTRHSAKMIYEKGTLTIEPEKTELIDTNITFKTSSPSWKMYSSMKYNAVVLENGDKSYGYAVEKNANSISKDFTGKKFDSLALTSDSYAYISKDETRAAIFESTDYSSKITFINLISGEVISAVKNDYRDVLRFHGLSDLVLAPYQAAYSWDGTTYATTHRFTFETAIEETEKAYKIVYTLSSNDGKISLLGSITYNFSSYTPEEYQAVETTLGGIEDDPSVLNVQIKKDKYSDTVLYNFHNMDSRLMMYTSDADGKHFMPSVISPMPISDFEYAQIISFGNYENSDILYMTVMTSQYDEEIKTDNDRYFVFMANTDSMTDENGEPSKPLIWNYSKEISLTSAGSEKYGVTRASSTEIAINN